MIFIGALILGIAFASAGMIAKQINSGYPIANRKMHLYVSRVGDLSNIVLPIIAVSFAVFVQGMAGGVTAVFGLALGAFALGLMRLSYSIKLFLSVFGVPLAGLIFLFCLFL